MCALKSEEWKQITEHPDYEVSNLGRIRSNKKWPSIIMKTRADRYGHLKLELDGKTRKVHQLVANAFLILPEFHESWCTNDGTKFCLCYMESQCVRHLNDDKSDNRAENLAWGTHSQNLIDAYVNGRRPSKKHGTSNSR